jgi:hypothetical protein
VSWKIGFIYRRAGRGERREPSPAEMDACEEAVTAAGASIPSE